MDPDQICHHLSNRKRCQFRKFGYCTVLSNYFLEVYFFTFIFFKSTWGEILVSSLLNLYMVLFAYVKVEEHSAIQGYEGLLEYTGLANAGLLPPLGEGVAEKQRPRGRSRHRP